MQNSKKIKRKTKRKTGRKNKSRRALKGGRILGNGAKGTVMDMCFQKKTFKNGKEQEVTPESS